MSPTETLRAAIAILRGEPAPEPHPVRLPPKMPATYAEPLADLLDTVAAEYEREPCDDPTGVCNRCEHDPTILAAETLAAALLGEETTR